MNVEIYCIILFFFNAAILELYKVHTKLQRTLNSIQSETHQAHITEIKETKYHEQFRTKVLYFGLIQSREH